MKPPPLLSVLSLVLLLMSAPSALASRTGLSNALGESPFSAAFLRDYNAAHERVYATKSAAPLEELLATYTRPEERAELEVSLGALYTFQGGIVDPAKAVEHLTNALRFRLPVHTMSLIVVWRGNMLERLEQTEPALKDYLRGLVICGQHLTVEQWPEVQPPPVPIYTNSGDPENAERARDYSRYHAHVRLQQDLLVRRHALIQGVRRLQVHAGLTETAVSACLAEVCADPQASETIRRWLAGPNEYPVP